MGSLLLSIFVLLSSSVVVQESMTIKTDEVEGLICTNFSEWKFILKEKDFWTPTKAQALKAEERIKEHLKNKPLSYVPDLWRKLPKYKRQYVGIIVNGHKRIFCNFYRSDEPLSDKPFFEFDGPYVCFWIEYDIEDQKCYNFEYSGYA